MSCHVVSKHLLTFILGEDALANLSVEQEGINGPVTGFMRIRSRSQGLALSLGSLKGLSKIGEMA
jgi:coatomer subunit beta